jgi:hypothetical protein
MSGIIESKSASALRGVGGAPWNKGRKGHVCKNPETCYHKIKPVGMKRPGQSEAMKRAYAEKPELVEVRRQQMAERWRLGLMNKAKIREGIIRSLSYRKPMSSEGRARQISAAQKIAAILNSKIVPEHNAKVASRMRELLSKGIQLIYVDLKGHQKPDLIWFDGKRIVSEDVKSTGTSQIEKEIIVT